MKRETKRVKEVLEELRESLEALSDKVDERGSSQDAQNLELVMESYYELADAVEELL
jgi:molybdopterin converting factor small subunit